MASRPAKVLFLQAGVPQHCGAAKQMSFNHAVSGMVAVISYVNSIVMRQRYLPFPEQVELP